MTAPAKPFTPIADALRQPVKCDGTFASVLGYGYGLAMPLRMPAEEELQRLLVEHATAELASGNHTVH